MRKFRRPRLFRDRVAEIVESVLDPEWDRDRRGPFTAPADTDGGDAGHTPPPAAPGTPTGGTCA